MNLFRQAIHYLPASLRRKFSVTCHLLHLPHSPCWYLLVFAVLLGSLSCSPCPCAAAPRNLLPRLPEFVIERGYSDSFKVVACRASAVIEGEEVHSRVAIELQNVSDREIDTSLKIRLLYLVSEHSVKLLQDGRREKFSRKNSRIKLRLAPQQTISLEVSARQSILYTREALTKAVQEEDGDNAKVGDKIKFGLGSLARFFARESFGQRFLVGPLVSKWGIFPVDFESVDISIETPSTFSLSAPDDKLWRVQKQHGKHIFRFEGKDGFVGTVFLPEADMAAFFKSRQEIRKLTGQEDQVPGKTDSTPTDAPVR